MAESSLLYAPASKVVSSVLERKYAVNIEGEENIPSHGRCIIASNHTKITDPYILLGWIKRRELAFLNRYDHKPSAFLELFEQIRMMGTYALGGAMIDRTSEEVQKTRISQLLPQPPSRDEAFEQLRQKLEQGKAICIFPEGQRNDSLRVENLKSGIAYLALDDEVGVSPIIPIGISYPHSKQDAHIRIGELFMPEGSASSEDDRKTLLNYLGQRMLDLVQ
jgi:1-acyl-sn-glycerol-3-phosphate acyltransferase